MKFSKFKRLLRIALPVLLILSGAGLLFLVNAYSTRKIVSAIPRKSVEVHIPKLTIATISGIPTRIVVPTLGIDLPVDKGYYNEQTQGWTLSGTHANFATMTAPANNQTGNTFIYGHNNKYVFATLHNLKIGDVVILGTDNGHNFYYTLREVKDVDPTDTSLFAYDGKPILTVQTCSGAWYQNRRLFTFDYMRVQ